jgi:dienelactone hydrolase
MFRLRLRFRLRFRFRFKVVIRMVMGGLVRTSVAAAVICSLLGGLAPGAWADVPLAGRPATEESVRFETRHIALEAGVADPIVATVKVPQGLRPGEKVPAFLVFGGFESAAHVLGLLHPRKPVALASFDYPFSASRDLRFPKSLAALPEAKRLFPRTQLAISQLVRQLRKRPEVDPDRVVIIGASFGSPFAVSAGAWTPGITGVVLVHGFGQVAETAEHVILRSWKPRYGWWAHAPAWLLSRAGWLYLGVNAPEDNARELRAGQRVLMVTATGDSFIPRESSDSLWSALSESKAHFTRKLMPTDHLMPGSEKLIDEIVGDVERWMEGWGREASGPAQRIVFEGGSR